MTLGREMITDVLADLAQAASVDPFSPLLQVGVTGAVLIITLLALRSVYQQQITTLQQTVAAERARADKIEDRLNTLNETVRDRVMVSMATSADAFREALRALESRR